MGRKSIAKFCRYRADKDNNDDNNDDEEENNASDDEEVERAY